METAQIETYYTKENGYHPFFIREHWQVAQLNYLPDHSFSSIYRIELHKQTDEVFVLTQGMAVLISAVIENDLVSFDCVLMQQGVTYNIPVNTWHTVAMREDAQMIIVEKSSTHLDDCTYYPLAESDKNKLRTQLLELVK